MNATAEQTITRELCDVCGLLCETAGFPRTFGPQLPARAMMLADTSDDDSWITICDQCVRDETIEDLRNGLPALVYVTEVPCAAPMHYGSRRIGSVRVTTWGDAFIAGGTYQRRAGSPITTWNAIIGRGPDAIAVYGRYGDGQASMARATKDSVRGWEAFRRG